MRTRSTFGRALAVVAAMAVLAACSSSKSPGGSGGSGGGSGGSPVQVAAVMELTGPYAAYGEQAKAAITYALDQAKGQGKTPISVKYYDCGAGSATCVNDVRQAISDGAQAIIGPIGSVNFLPTVNDPTRSDVPQLISTPVTVPSGHDNVFRFGNTEQSNNETQAAYIASKVPAGGKVAILYASNDYGQQAKSEMQNLLAKKGITVSKTVNLQAAQPDYTPAILGIKASHPQFVALYMNTAADVSLILKQAKQYGLNVPFITDGTPGVPAAAGAAAEGLYQAGPWFPLADANSKNKAFIQAVTNETKAQPNFVTAMSQDQAQALIQVVEGGARKAKDIVTALENLRNFNGMAVSAKGKTFGDGNTYITKAVLIVVKNGQYLSVHVPTS